MVATGKDESDVVDHVEVINTNRIESCPNLPKRFPHFTYDAIAMTYHDKIVICGGLTEYDYTSDCHAYDYKSNDWVLEPFQLLPLRFSAVSVEIRPDEWMILGGESPGDTLKDTQVFKNGQFFQGPDLPIPLRDHSGVMLDPNRLFISGGGFNNRTFILDINTEQWTEVANSYGYNEDYEKPISGTFFNSTANEIQVAMIGRFGLIGLQVYSPRNDEWRIGFELPQLFRSVAIQQGPNSFIIIGGDTGNGYSGDIYHFDEDGLKVVKENVLAISRRSHIAMPIPEDQFSC